MLSDELIDRFLATAVSRVSDREEIEQAGDLSVPTCIEPDGTV